MYNLGRMPDVFVAEPAAGTAVKKRRKARREHHFYGHTHNPLAALSYYPDKVKFENADREERIVLLLRRHPITNLGWIVSAFFMLLLPLLADLLGFLVFLPTNYFVVAHLAWYLITTAFVFEKFLGWFFSVYVITDERVFDVDFVNLIYKEIAETNIDQIQDVTTKTRGGIRTLFNYGNIIIQTAGAIPQIDFEAVPDPDGVSKILRELRVEEEKEKLEGRVR